MLAVAAFVLEGGHWQDPILESLVFLLQRTACLVEPELAAEVLGVVLVVGEVVAVGGGGNFGLGVLPGLVVAELVLFEHPLEGRHDFIGFGFGEIKEHCRRLILPLLLHFVLGDLALHRPVLHLAREHRHDYVRVASFTRLL